MAVPFSRPRQANRSSAGQHAQPQPQYQHPIARFLYGDGVMNLDRVNRLTRITFYALYEAWRLLQELTPQEQQPRIEQEPLMTQPDPVTPLTPTTEVGKTDESNGNLPDVLPSESARFYAVDEQEKEIEVSLSDLQLVSSSSEEETSLPDVVNCTLDEPDHGYFSANSSMCQEPLEDPGDALNPLDKTDNIKDPWTQTGVKLITLASAFDISYGSRFENDRQRATYELYQRMRNDLLRNQARTLFHQTATGQHTTVFDLGKAALSQALLAGLWYILKKMAWGFFFHEKRRKKMWEFATMSFSFQTKLEQIFHIKTKFKTNKISTPSGLIHYIFVI